MNIIVLHQQNDDYDNDDNGPASSYSLLPLRDSNYPFCNSSYPLHNNNDLASSQKFR